MGYVALILCLHRGPGNRLGLILQPGRSREKARRTLYLLSVKRLTSKAKEAFDNTKRIPPRTLQQQALFEQRPGALPLPLVESHIREIVQRGRHIRLVAQFTV